MNKLIENLIKELEKNPKKLEEILKLLPSTKEKLKFLEKLQQWINEYLGRKEVKIKVPYDLGEEEKEMIINFLKKFIEAKELKFIFEKDENLYGGFKAFFDFKILDASLNNFINKLWKN